MTDHYAKLCDNLEFDRSETPIPESSPANTGANSLSLNSGRRLKAAKLVKILVISQLIAGLLIFGCGSMCLGVTIHSPQFESDVVCAFGTGIWVGLSCTASGLVGIFLLRKKYSKSLTVTFMVTSIVSSIFCGIEVIFSGIWLALLDRSIRQFSYMSIASRSYHDSTINSQDDSKDAVFLYLRGNLALNSIACLSACINSKFFFGDQINSCAFQMLLISLKYFSS